MRIYFSAMTIENFGALVGRLFISFIFIWSGAMKLINPVSIQAYFASLGLPLPEIAWFVAVVVELLGGLALLLGFKARYVAGLLALWCIATAVAGHSNLADPDMQIHFMKNVAIAGGLIYVAISGAGAYAIDICSVA